VTSSKPTGSAGQGLDPKLRIRDAGSVTGMKGAVSPDGLHWTMFAEPMVMEVTDTQLTAYYDVRLAEVCRLHAHLADRRPLDPCVRGRAERFWRRPPLHRPLRDVQLPRVPDPRDDPGTRA